MLILLSRCLTETADGSDELTDPEGTQAGSLRYIRGTRLSRRPLVSKETEKVLRILEHSAAL
jgi:hypothetical protein